MLLSSLFTATHPVSASTAAALTSSLTHNITLAQNLSGLEESLVQQREATQQKLVETKALERRWREKENEMYQVLQPFSSVAQIGRLQAAVGEAERLSEEMAEDFLGGVDGSEVETWIRGYRELREVATLRKERAGRLAEGRVGNWR